MDAMAQTKRGDGRKGEPREDLSAVGPDVMVRGFTLGELREMEEWVQELREDLQEKAGGLTVDARAVSRNHLLLMVVRGALAERRKGKKP